MLNIPHGYRQLPPGTRKQAGDMAFTWADPDCTTQGWVKLRAKDVLADSDAFIDEGHVPVIRALDGSTPT